ncbi:MAG: ATP-binding protein, partial [Brevinematia bacterium]
MNERNNVVGIVMGTEESKPYEFWFQVMDNQIISVGDVVKVENKINDKEVIFYGIVSDVVKGFEGINFHSWNTEVVNGKIPYQRYHKAFVRITVIKPEDLIIPPEPGSKVIKISEETEIKVATKMDNKPKLIPAGIMNNGLPAYINWEFLNGEKGAHVSISGISGIATKTSYSLFLIHSMLYCKSLDNSEKRNIKVIIFNVKGEDLLHIDKNNGKFKASDKEQFELLKIPPHPFGKEDIQFFTPPSEKNPDEPLSEERKNNINIFSWSLKDFLKFKLINYMFEEDEKVDDNFYNILSHISEVLAEAAAAEKAPEGSIQIGNHKIKINSLFDESPSIGTDEEISEKLEKEGIALNQLFILVRNLDKSNEIRNKLFPREISEQTISKFIRKFSASARDIGFMIGNESRRIEWENTRVTVINISDKFLTSRAQRFVVGSLLSEIYYGEKSPKSKGYTLFIMLDELNKYAPATGSSPIKSILLDIAERGRSLGIILIGAQQMASEVEPRIISNSSIKVIGRMDSGEIENKNYKYL